MKIPIRRLAISAFMVVSLFFVWENFQQPRALTTEVYVWQREESSALQSALAHSQEIASCRHFLAAEIGKIDGQWQIKRSKFSDEIVRGNGLVIRIGSSLSNEKWNPGEALAKVLAEIAWTASKPVTALQIDYDSPQRSLGNYLRLLETVKTAHPDKKWTITALPSWLDAPDAKQLFTTADGVVMQLHSLQLPDQPDMPVVLCDPIAARKTVGKMSNMGIPYHIALNTYSCEVWFDGKNRVIDVISEDLHSSTSPSAIRRSMGISDAVQLASLVREWKQNPPPHLQGIIWYRLPIETDRRNWKWITWQRAARGEIPISDLRLEARATENGTWDIVLTNYGERDERLPEIIDVGCETLVLEGLNGYDFSTSQQLHLKEVSWPWLAPQASFTLGWFRTNDPATIPHLTFKKSP